MPVPPVISTACSAIGRDKTWNNGIIRARLVGNQHTLQDAMASLFRERDDQGPRRIGLDRACIRDRNHGQVERIGRGRAVFNDGLAHVSSFLVPVIFVIDPG